MFNFFIKQTYKLPDVPGAKADGVNPLAPHYGTQFQVGAGAVVDSVDWSQYLPPFRYQGWIPSCVAHATTSIIYALNNKYDNRKPLCSAAWLFFKSGGSKTGSLVEANATTAREIGAVYEADKPYPKTNDYSYETWQALRDYALNVGDEAIARAADNKTKSNAYVNPAVLAEVVDAMSYTPVGLVVPVHKNYMNAMDGWTEVAKPEYHYVVLSKQYADGHRLIFDSLTQKAGFDGFHELPANYPVTFAQSYRDLPNTWQETQKSEAEKLYPVAYGHYGKPRLPLIEEQQLAAQLRTYVESYPDVGIRTIAGRYWIVLLNAALYGGYSYYVIGPDGKKYFAFRDHGSDLANALYHYRRTGQFPFNFDKLRSEQ